ASRLAPQAATALAADGATFKLTGDGSSYGDQLALGGVALARNTDYVVTVTARVESGRLAAKVTDAMGQTVLASAILGDTSSPGRGRDPDAADDAADQTGLSVTRVAFASGPYEQVKIVLSNNGGQAVADIGSAELYEAGPTAGVWTRWLRPAVRGVQKNLYTTVRMLALVLGGLLLLSLARRWQALIVLLAVPVYYLTTHSAFSTEYRYILAMHFFLFVLAAVTLFVIARAIGGGVRRLKPFVPRRPRQGRAQPANH
ncbi:MAG TPA: hypothetical protein VJZ91_02105, partial [Blastocatellia bacterium]|nr:hypothetical protein [Blastocatellia bacterium]